MKHSSSRQLGQLPLYHHPGRPLSAANKTISQSLIQIGGCGPVRILACFTGVHCLLKKQLHPLFRSLIDSSESFGGQKNNCSRQPFTTAVVSRAGSFSDDLCVLIWRCFVLLTLTVKSSP